MIAFIVFITFAALFSSSEAQPTCKKIKRAENFDLSRYAQGTWYEIGRSKNDWENRGNCVLVSHTKQNNGTIIFKIATVVDGKANNVEGTINLDPEAKGTGYIDYYSGAYQGSEGSNLLPVEILAIDYDKYAIAYDCHYDEREKKLHSYIWILGRSATLDDASKKTVMDTIENANVFDSQKISWNHFSKDKCNIVA